MADNVNKLLIVEHDAAVVALVGKAAEEAGYAVASATSGAAFVQLLESFHPTLIVIGANMPDTSGSELLTSLAIITVLFAVIYKVLPDVTVDWSDVWVGAFVAAGLFVMGRNLIALYLTYTAPTSTYGAAGTLVLLLLWVYYSALILLFGAALTKARALASGKRIVPRATAVRVQFSGTSSRRSQV